MAYTVNSYEAIKLADSHCTGYRYGLCDRKPNQVIDYRKKWRSDL